MRSTRIPRGDVTASDLMGQLSALRQEVGQVLTSVEVMKVERRGDGAQLSDHEVRIRAMERWKWQIGGALALVAVVTGVLSGWLGTVLAHAHP